MTRISTILLMAIATISSSCGLSGSDTNSDPLDGWVLAWSDEFEGARGTVPDPTIWSYDIGGNGWGNEQLEFNTDRPENASMDGEGNLAITARREAFEGNQYTSARLKTEQTLEVTYGRVEARISMPEGRGIWPAFWMLGSDFETVGWPACGEIDIVEYRGQDPAIVHGTVHGPGYSGGQGITELTAVAGGAAGEFHVYAIEWEPSEIRWYVDGVQYHSVSKDTIPPTGRWVFDHPFFLLLNVAVGGTFLGNPDASTQFPQQMLVDYVRVYERG